MFTKIMVKTVAVGFAVMFELTWTKIAYVMFVL